MADLDLVAHRDDMVDAPAPRLTHLVVIASGLVRLAIAALTPVFPDETYYWEWSRHLAAGYYDHPPMIAWLIRLGTMVAGDTALGVRLGAVIAGVVATLLLCAAARRYVGGGGGERAALLTAVIFATMPLSAAGLTLATPDAPLLAAAAATIYALVRVFETAAGSRDSAAWWCGAGAALGLAFCSKITSALLPLGVFAGLLSSAASRVRLREPGPYLATVIALLVFLPVIQWNARHDWVSFAFQLQHGFGGTSGSVLKRELDLLGGQVGLVSPILFTMFALAVARTLWPSRPSASYPIARVVAVTAVVIFGFFMYSATRRRVEANWPALAYLPAVLLLVSRAGNARWDKWLRAGVVLAGILTLVTYVNAFVPVLPVPARRDPAARASGWKDLAAAVRRLDSTRSRPSERIHLAADRYQEASALAFYLPGHPETYSVNLSSRANQYDLWPPFAARAKSGDAMLLIVDDVEGTHPSASMLAPHFTTLEKGPLVQLTRNGDLVKNLRIWLLGGWRGTWPTSRLRSGT